MKLWIRSQDRCYLQEITGFKDNGTSIWGYSYTDTGILLGTYKSKERTLEVLDKIQDKLLDNVIATNDDGYATLLENTCFYEMPQE